jgi:FLVCR family MFS transporter 7
MTAVINIIVGFIGAFLLNFFAKKTKMQTDFAKVSFALACTSTIMMMMALDQYHKLWWISAGFAGFGFFGYAAYPMTLELAVEETYPLDASMSEAFVHIVSNSSAIFLVLLGNIMYKDLEPGSPHTCAAGDEDGSIGVEARDYTPYYYLIMSLATVLSIAFILFMRPTMRRSEVDEIKQK